MGQSNSRLWVWWHRTPDRWGMWRDRRYRRVSIAVAGFAVNARMLPAGERKPSKGFVIG